MIPSAGKIAIAVDPAEAREFSLKLRIPAWCKKSSLQINSEPVKAQKARDGYVFVKRTWKPGDMVELDLTLEPRVVVGNHSNQDKLAILDGPLVLAADEACWAARPKVSTPSGWHRPIGRRRPSGLRRGR